jgi:hypothetical protein
MARGKSEEGELVGSFEVGSFVGVEDHEVITDMKVAVNKPITGLPTEHSQRIFGERFEIIKKKVGATINPHGEMSAVQKKWKGIQKPLGGEKGEISTPSRYSEPENSPDREAREGGLSPLQTLKNFVDNIASDNRQTRNWVKTALILSGIGLAGFVLSVALIFK